VPVDVVGKESTEDVRIPGALRSATVGSGWVAREDIEGAEAVGLRAVLASGTERLRKDIVRTCLWLKYPNEFLVLSLECGVDLQNFDINFRFLISPPPSYLTFTSL
jgi:hypothetical protein